MTARSAAYASPPCPQDPAHGPLLAWPGETTGFYCPSVRHRGNAFFTTDLAPAPRSGHRDAVPENAGSDSGALSEAPEPGSSAPRGAGALPLVAGVANPLAAP